MKNLHFLLAFTACLLIPPVFAQPGTNDPTFNPSDIGFGSGNGANLGVDVIATQPDGKAVVGGHFTSYNSDYLPYLVRINADGSPDASFLAGEGPNYVVNVIVFQPDGKILIGGSFDEYNGIDRSRIARLNADGSLDETFQVGTGCDGSVLAMALQSDGKIVIGGNFSNYNGNASECVARLNVDGSFDATFDVGTGPDIIAFGADVYGLEIQLDGKVLVAGNFSSFDGTNVGHIVRLNPGGDVDGTFLTGSGAQSGIRAMELQPDGGILIAGFFVSFNGTSRMRIARLLPTGSVDPSFDPESGLANIPHDIELQPNGKILVAGSFSDYDGTPVAGVVRINPDGNIDPAFTPGTGGGVKYTVSVRPDGKILAGGNYTAYNNLMMGHLTCLHADGMVNMDFNPQTAANGDIFTVSRQPDDKLIIGGRFFDYDWNHSYALARLLPNGDFDPSFVTGTGPSLPVHRTLLLPDGKLLIGGEFTYYNAVSIKRMARLEANGALDPGFVSGNGFDGTVYALAVQPDGKILVGGGFGLYNDTVARRLIRLLPNGTIDPTFTVGTGADYQVFDLAVQSDGKILVAGFFDDFNGTPAGNIVRLNADGSVDATFNSGTGANFVVWDIELLTDGQCVIAGSFNMYDNQPCEGVAKLNANGTRNAFFNPGTEWDAVVKSVAVQPNGKVIAAGEFTSINGETHNHIVRLNLDGSVDPGFETGDGTNNPVSRVLVLPDDQVIIAGYFTSYDGTGRNRIARLNNCAVNNGGSLTQESCGAYTGADGITYENSGVYDMIVPSAEGCDSLVVLSLTINAAPDTSVTVTDFIHFQSNQSGATYQWINCVTGDPIPGATAQSYTATVNGSYAVVVTGTNGCSDTSACQVLTTLGIAETSIVVSIAPNPAVESITIMFSESSNGEIEWIDLHGKTISGIQDFSGYELVLPVSDFAPGVYLLRVNIDGKIGVYRVVIGATF